MKNFFRRIKYHMTPGKVLTKNQNVLIVCSVLAAIALGLSGIYINMFIYTSAYTLSDSTYAMQAVIRFNLYMCLSAGAMSLVMGYTGQKIAPKYSMFLGLLLYVILYFMLLLMQQEVYRYILLLAVIDAAASAFYYISINSVMSLVTDDRGRDVFLMIHGVFAAISTLIAPITGGFVIDASGSSQGGYMAIFTVSMLLLCGSAVAVLTLPKSPLTATARNFTRVLFYPLVDKNTRFVAAGEFFKGLRETAMAVLMPLFMFIICQANGIVGVYSFICIALQILSGIIAKKYMIIHNRKKFLFIGCITCALSSVLFLISVDEMMIFAYGIITSITYGFITNSTIDIYYYAINRIPRQYLKMPEITAAREVYLNIGRAVGMLFVFLMSSEFLLIVYAIALLGALQIFVWLFYSLAKTGRF